MTAVDTFVDVLVIGAGPAGVMAANALNNAGINVRIVDKKYVRRLGFYDSRLIVNGPGKRMSWPVKRTGSSHVP